MRIRRIDGGWAFVHVVRTGFGEPVRVLRVGGAYQSATYLGERWHEPPFEYYRAFDRLFDAGREGARCDATFEAPTEKALNVRSVLVIGGGGCSYPKHLLASRDGVAVDVVERDRRIAAIARRFFFVDRLERMLRERGEEARFRLIVTDGLSYLESCERRYDAIVNDAFVGRDPVRELMEPSALSRVKDRLTSGGLYVTNFVVGDDPADVAYLQGAVASLKDAFAHVSLIVAADAEFSEEDNHIVIATDGAYAFDGGLEV